MSVIIILIILALVIAGGFLAAFLWAVNNGQYDDTQGAAIRMLLEDPEEHKRD